MMSVKYFKYYTIVLRGGAFFRGHTLPCGFYLSIFFPRLISAVADWMSTILRHMVWPYYEFKMQV